VDDRRDVRERVPAVIAFEGADQYLPSRQKQEEERVGEERDDDEPGKRQPPPAGP